MKRTNLLLTSLMVLGGSFVARAEPITVYLSGAAGQYIFNNASPVGYATLSLSNATDVLGNLTMNAVPVSLPFFSATLIESGTQQAGTLTLTNTISQIYNGSIYN